MNILITGASGLIGTALGRFLSAAGHRVAPLVRANNPGAGGQATWDLAHREVDLSRAGPLDAAIHLAGESIAQRWTAAARARIRNSRVDGTRLLSETLAALPQPPRVLVSASAVGFYGDRGEEMLDEGSAPGKGFLADTCQAWEAATAAAQARGIRVVHLRLGIVLSRSGGALARMAPIFRLGLGGRMGHGRQYWSWIALDDLLRLAARVLEDDSLRGPINAVSPEAVTNAQFTRALAEALGRPAFLAMPAVAVRGLFGQMGVEALLASARVRPACLQRAGFQFQSPELKPALAELLAGR
jgi:uncharacterized protein